MLVNATPYSAGSGNFVHGLPPPVKAGKLACDIDSVSAT